jgi:hypothetical protein
MDLLGGIFILIFVVIIIYPNFVFNKGIKSIKKNHFKYKLFYFLITFVISCFIVAVAFITIGSGILDEILDFSIVTNRYIFRFFYGCVIFFPSIFINIYFAKFYLKRISKTKNEIELIGKE